MKPTQWVLGDDTGISSKTIWAVMMDAVRKNPRSSDYDTPHDPSDFGRCYRLLQLFPDWRKRLHEVPAIFPKWGPLVREWDRLTAIYERDLDSGKSDELYNAIQKLEDEGLIAAGWKETSKGCWHKAEGSIHKFKWGSISFGD